MTSQNDERLQHLAHARQLASFDLSPRSIYYRRLAQRELASLIG